MVCIFTGETTDKIKIRIYKFSKNYLIKLKTITLIHFCEVKMFLLSKN